MLKWSCCTNAANKSEGGQSYSEDSRTSQKEVDVSFENQSPKQKSRTKNKGRLQPQVENIQTKSQLLRKMGSNDKIIMNDHTANKRQIESNLQEENKMSSQTLKPFQTSLPEGEMKQVDLHQLLLNKMNPLLLQQNRHVSIISNQILVSICYFHL